MLKVDRVALLALALGVAVTVPGFATAQYTKKPSKVVQLQSNVGTNYTWADFDQISPDGTNLGVFTVPLGRVFVMTSVTLFVLDSGSTDLAWFQLGQTGSGGTTPRTTWRIPYGEVTHLTFPSGIVIESGASLRARAQGYTGAFPVLVTGYLAPDV